MTDEGIEVVELTAEKLLEELPEGFTPGRKAEHENGVAFFAPWEDGYAGFPTHARRCARALSLTGMPVHLRSLSPAAQWEMSGASREVSLKGIEHLLNTSIKCYSHVVRMVVPSLEVIASAVTHPYLTETEMCARNAATVLYTVWERQSIEPEYASLFNRAGQCWVATADSARVLARAGVHEDKLRVIPCPYDPDDPLLALSGRKRKPGPVRFYHIGKWEPRKAQDQLLGAFLRAFKPDQAIFLLKTSERSPKKIEPYPAGPHEAVAAWLKDPEVQKQGWTEKNIDRGVMVRREAMTIKQMRKIHEMGDVYVSMSRGEGWDMPAFDAKLAGNLLCYVPSGGPQEFASPTDVRIETCGTVPCHPFYEWPGCEYLNYSLDAAVEGLVRAEARIRCWSLPPADLSRFSLEAVGAKMQGCLSEVG